jgi:hypothetical protein
MKNILEKIQCDKISSDINFDACIVDENHIEIFCWDGKRFLLLKLNDDPKYDSDTGKII